MWNQTGRAGRELLPAPPRGGGEPRTGARLEGSGGEQRQRYPAQGSFPLSRTLWVSEPSGQQGPKAYKQLGVWMSPTRECQRQIDIASAECSYKGTLLGQTLILGQALCIQVLSIFIFTTTLWRDATIRVSRMSWWVLADSALGPSRCVLYLNSLDPFSFPASCPCCIHFFLGLHTEVSTFLAESFEDGSCPITSPSLCVTLRNMQPSSYSRTPTAQSLLHGPLSADDQPWMDPTITGLKCSYTAYPRGSKNRTRKSSGMLQAPIKAPQGRWLWLVKPCVTALSTPWLKDFFLKHLFQWIPSPPLDRLDMGTKGW